MKVKIILFLFVVNYSLSIVVFPFKIRENYAEQYENPLNLTKIKILDYLHHILNDFEFISEIDVGIPRQKVELLFNFDSNYLTILGNSNSKHPYYYNLSASYKEIKINDENCPLKVEHSVTIKELFHIKNEFKSNLNQFLSSDKEISHEFIIIFNKFLPTLKPLVPNKYFDSNLVNIGILFNTRYNGEHGIYKPFLNEMKEHGYIENYLHFLYFFEEYKGNLDSENKNTTYEGLIAFGKYPHELLPNKFNIKNLFWTNTFLTHSKIVESENIQWGIKFNKVYIDYGNNKTENFEFLRGIFDLNVDYIFPPYKYYETIKNFFRPLRKICFIDSTPRFFHKDENIYRMIYCDYEEFGKKYLKTFPRLVFKIDDFKEEFEFTYKDLFKPIYNKKYYLFLIFTGRFWRASEYIVQFPNYPWTLGRIFFKKYQFVFDALKKKVGYYNNKININSEITEVTEEIKRENNNQSISINGLKTKVINKGNGNNKQNSNNISNIVFIGIIIIVLSIILVIFISFCHEILTKKNKRKKRLNELIDEH
jgi:hypothetical protein